MLLMPMNHTNNPISLFCSIINFMYYTNEAQKLYTSKTLRILCKPYFTHTLNMDYTSQFDNSFASFLSNA